MKLRPEVRMNKEQGEAVRQAESKRIYAYLVRRDVIRPRDAQEVEREAYERALSSLRKYGP